MDNFSDLLITLTYLSERFMWRQHAPCLPTIQPATDANLITRLWKTADRNRCSYSSFMGDCRRHRRRSRRCRFRSFPPNWHWKICVISVHHTTIAGARIHRWETIRPSRTEANKLCYYIRMLPETTLARLRNDRQVGMRLGASFLCDDCCCNLFTTYL